MTASTASSVTEEFHGGDWLVRDSDPVGLLTPELLNEEQRLIARTVDEFVINEVLPNLDRLDQKDWRLARDLVKRAGALGLLGVDVPEASGGLQLDKVTSMLVSEHMSRSASFGATFGAQANLTILPLTLFGTESQKQKYLPRLLTGELVGAYCLSEPGSGSDALGARTRAVRQADGSFVLNGEKAWITNGGLADIFIVFGKVIDANGEHFSAFVVERSYAGVSNGNEEHKMGLHGSSTTPVILQNVRVPAENLLGEVGTGHRVAFNVLNFARFKLGAMCTGGARNAIGEAARYAAQRKQFGQPIGSFGAIKHKLGEMVLRAYAVESLVYRTAGLIEARIQSTPHAPGDQSVALATLDEYAIEASIAKVAGSEMLDFVLDENIQIHGGNGYVRDYPAERHYRDARVNRIFEGTNEINRLLISGILARRAVKGDAPILSAIQALQSTENARDKAATTMSPLDAARLTVTGLKQGALLVFGAALQTYENRLSDEQEMLTYLADILMDVYAADSAVLRATVMSSSPNASLLADAACVFVSTAAMRIDAAARQALATMGSVMLTARLKQVDSVLRVAPIDTVTPRRRIADATLQRGGYPFQSRTSE